MNTDLQFHPLCTLFPRLEGIEFDALKADIEANGQLQPIVLHDGMVLDGGNRYRACIELGIEPATSEFQGGDPISFVLSANFHRRHLSAGQQAAVVAAAQNWANAAGHGGARTKVQPLHLETAADRAKVAHASLRTQRMADKVAKADPELAKRVAHGEISLPKAIKQVDGKAVADADQNNHASFPVDPDQESSSGDDDPYAEIETLQKRVSALSREIDSLTSNDTGAEIHKLTQLLFNAEAKIESFEEKLKALKWFGGKFAELRKLLDVKFDRDVVTRVRALTEAAK